MNMTKEVFERRWVLSANGKPCCAVNFTTSVSVLTLVHRLAHPSLDHPPNRNWGDGLGNGPTACKNTPSKKGMGADLGRTTLPRNGSVWCQQQCVWELVCFWAGTTLPRNGSFLALTLKVLPSGEATTVISPQKELMRQFLHVFFFLRRMR